jgi:hypothetical protein
MCAAFARSREILKELYGLEFPDSLFHLHEFFRGLTEAELDALSMHPSGLLKVLDLPRTKLAKLQPKYPMLLHWRFYRDPPEFFSCLHGECDGEHWGLLLDEPEKGFRGMAAYYNNDGDNIRVYTSPFDAVLAQIDAFLDETDEMIDADPGHEDDYREQERIRIGLRGKVERYMAEHAVPLDEGRPRGVPNDTGLSLIVPGKRLKQPPSVSEDHQLADKGCPRVEGMIREALDGCGSGQPLAALGIGRSLHYWGGREYASDAYQLLRSAYLALDRPALVRVLDVHHQHRDLPSVEVLSPR